MRNTIYDESGAPMGWLEKGLAEVFAPAVEGLRAEQPVELVAMSAISGTFFVVKGRPYLSDDEMIELRDRINQCLQAKIPASVPSYTDVEVAKVDVQRHIFESLKAGKVVTLYGERIVFAPSNGEGA